MRRDLKLEDRRMADNPLDKLGKGTLAVLGTLGVLTGTVVSAVAFHSFKRHLPHSATKDAEEAVKDLWKWVDKDGW